MIRLLTEGAGIVAPFSRVASVASAAGVATATSFLIASRSGGRGADLLVFVISDFLIRLLLPPIGLLVALGTTVVALPLEHLFPGGCGSRGFVSFLPLLFPMLDGHGLDTLQKAV